MSFDSIPLELKQHPYWCVWKYEQQPNEEKPRKIPYHPPTAQRAKSNDPTTFASFEIARQALGVAADYSGIGVGVFGNLAAVDIDSCIDLASGQISELARDVMSTFNTYTEISPSGSGLRLFFYAPGFQYDKARYYINNQKAGLEVYIAGNTSRFVTVTGNVYGLPLSLATCTDKLPQILDRYMLRENASETLATTDSLTSRSVLADEQVIEKIRKEAGGKFSVLYAFGDWQNAGYPSQSEADQAFCNKLAFYCGRDLEQMDRIFRQSSLMRDKWDNHSTYSTNTLERAARDCAVIYGNFTSAAADFEGVAGSINPFENKGRYLRNDQGNGYLFADLFADKLRYCPQAKKWYVYADGQWQPDNGDATARECAKKMAAYLYRFMPDADSGEDTAAYEKNAKQLYSLAARERMLKDAQSVNPLRIEDLDTSSDLFNVQNGTLNLRTWEFNAHSPADMISKKSGAAFVLGADCPLWKKTLNEIFIGAPELVRYLQKVLGYALLGDPVEKQFFILYGANTNNGKSTITQTIEWLFGGYAVNTAPETIAEKRFKDSSRPSGDRARLAGVRFVSVNEPERGMRLDEAYVKAITGMDTQTARHLHQSEFQYQVQFIILIGTNHLPYVFDRTLFKSGRVRVIPIERSFTEAEQDKTLVNRLRQPEELNGILNWMLEGLTAYRQEGLTPPAAVAAAVKAYELKSDNVQRFMDACTEPDTDGAIPIVTLKQIFDAWCNVEGIKMMAMTSFSTALKEREFDVHSGRHEGSNVISHVWGIKCVQSG